ncbi:MAG: isopentenyl-diphosphate Delta-isomerase [Roseovarius sp.]
MIPTWVGGDLVAVEKLQAHREGLRHKAVSVFVICGDEMLLQRRAMGKYHTPGLWANSCCTHPHWGESPEACAARRLDEELGLKALPLQYRQQVEYRADVGAGLIEHEVVDIFVARIRGRIPVAPNPDEVMEVQWARMADLEKLIRQYPHEYTPWLRIYLEDYAEQIFA